MTSAKRTAQQRPWVLPARRASGRIGASMTMKQIVDSLAALRLGKLTGKKVATLTIATYERELPKLDRPLRGWETENE